VTRIKKYKRFLYIYAIMHATVIRATF